MFDIILTAILVVGFFQGLHDGFVKSLCGFLGFFLGLVVAYTFYAMVGEHLAPHLGGSVGAARVLAFLLLWLAVPVVLNFVGTLLTGVLEALFLGGVNRLAGGALGVAKYMLGISLVLYALILTGMLDREVTDESFLGGPLVSLVETLMDSFQEKAALA